jgi:hypothetical protein
MDDVEWKEQIKSLCKFEWRVRETKLEKQLTYLIHIYWKKKDRTHIA